MENEFSPEIYELAEKKLAALKNTCEISRKVEPELLTALLRYYDKKKENPNEAIDLWGKVQHILDACELKNR